MMLVTPSAYGTLEFTNLTHAPARPKSAGGLSQRSGRCGMAATKKRVLVVDDELEFARMVKLILEMTGSYLVRDVHLSREVLKVAREFKPDVVLLDCMMPDMDGGEVAAMLQNDPELKDTPFIF